MTSGHCWKDPESSASRKNHRREGDPAGQSSLGERGGNLLIWVHIGVMDHMMVDIDRHGDVRETSQGVDGQGE